MQKIAIFVEGYTEMIFVRELLLRKYSWSVNICSLILISDNYHNPKDEFVSKGSSLQFLIINCCNDKKVVSAMLERESELNSVGYSKIIGLRDMYSSEYKEDLQEMEMSNQIIENLNQQYIEIGNTTLSSKSKKLMDTVLCFSIMEIEAWFLSMYHIFEKLHSSLTVDFIKQNTSIDLCNIDPERTIFHPADLLKSIYSIGGCSYNKKKGDIEKFCSYLCIEDFETLYSRPVCNSFNHFYNQLP